LPIDLTGGGNGSGTGGGNNNQPFLDCYNKFLSFIDYYQEKENKPEEYDILVMYLSCLNGDCSTCLTLPYTKLEGRECFVDFCDLTVPDLPEEEEEEEVEIPDFPEIDLGTGVDDTWDDEEPEPTELESDPFVQRGPVWWYHSDHLGSTSYITDILGMPCQYIEYLPFGEVMVQQSTNNIFENVYKFNAKELDESTGYYYYGARYYDPAISIFLSVDPLAEKYPGINPYTYVANNPINFTDPTGMVIEPGSQKQWDKQKQNVVNELDRLQGKIDRLNSKAESKGWSTEKLAGKIGNMQERVNSLNGTIDNLGVLEASSQVYALKSGAGEQGGTTYDPLTGNIVFSYDGTANFVHETTHGGQFESGNIAFDTNTGTSYGSDVFDEVAAYKAQFGYSPSSVSGLTSSSKVNSFGGITISWLQGLTKSDGAKIYSQGGSANTGISPVNMNTNRDGLIKAYPHQKGTLSKLPASFTLKDVSTIYYKK
jgi:RHS repeat-associated protein